MLKLIGSTFLMVVYVATVLFIVIVYAIKMVVDLVLTEVVTLFANLSKRFGIAPRDL